MGVEISGEASQPTGGDEIEILPDAWGALSAFLTLETQWKYLSGFGGSEHIGLDYGAVEIILRRLDLPDDTFFDILEMERAALEAMRDAK